MSAEDTAMWNEATKAYNKLKLAQHRVYMSDLSVKIQLKKAALAALPGGLKSPEWLPIICSVLHVYRPNREVPCR